MRIQQALNKEALVAVVIIFAALIIRLEYKHLLVIERPIRQDAFHYMAYGYNLSVHKTFSKELPLLPDSRPKPDSFWAPGFPFLVAAAMNIGGLEDYRYYHLVLSYNAILSTIVVGLVFYLGTQFLPLWAAAAAAGLTAVSPHLISFSGYFLTETLFGFLLFSGTLFYILAVKKDELLFWILSGALFGFAYLTNPIILFLPFIFVGFNLLIRKESFSRELKKKIVFLSIFLFICGGWSLRNIMNVEKGARSSQERAVENFIIGSYPGFSSDYQADRTRDKDYPVNLDKKTAGGSLLKAVEIAAARFINSPGEYICWYLLKKPYLFWSWNILVGFGDIHVYSVRQSLFTVSLFFGYLKALMKIFHPLLALLALSGIWFCFKAGRKNMEFLVPAFLLITLIYCTLIYVIFQAEPRYSIPFRPQLYLCALWVVHLITGSRNHQIHTPASP